MLLFISYRTKSGRRKVRYFISYAEAMRFDKEISVNRGITDIIYGKS